MGVCRDVVEDEPGVVVVVTGTVKHGRFGASSHGRFGRVNVVGVVGRGGVSKVMRVEAFASVGYTLLRAAAVERDGIAELASVGSYVRWNVMR